MDYFIDVKIIPDDEMRKNVLLNKVYSKLHKALFTLKSTEIGVSFPLYKVMLGDVIRLHGTEEKLTGLHALDWLGGLQGYCTVSAIQAIPVRVVYRNISRKQSNMTEAKLRRLIKRDTISQGEIKKYKAKMFQLGLDNPFLELESTSNGHKHRRYIQFGKLNEQAIKGKFDYFGLSKIATVPWF